MPRHLAALLLAVALAGCAAHVPMASPEQDAAAKRFAAPADRANLYVYRHETFGFAVTLPLTLDGMQLGETAAQTYFVVPLAPGEHTLLSKGESTVELVLDVAAGRNYFVWQEVKMGFASARSALHQVDDATGRGAVGQCQLAKTSWNGATPGGCAKDNDCKGARICHQGTCVEPARAVPGT
jgi:hypothetical protein